MENWTILFFIIAAQGFFLSFLIIAAKNTNRQATIFLSALIFVFSLILLFWIGFWNGISARYIHFNFTYSPFPFLIGPLFLFYVKSLFQKFSRKDLIHLFLFVIVVIYFSPYYILMTEQKLSIAKGNNLEQVLWNWENLRYASYYLDLISFIGYSIYGHLFYLRQKRKPTFQKISFFTRKQLYLVVIFFDIYVLLHIFNFVSLRYLKIPIFYYYFDSVLISIFIYLIGYLAVNKEVFVKTLQRKYFKKYVRSSLSQNDMPAMIKRLIDYIESEKPYLKGDYKLENLSKEIKIPRHHISELLNIYNKKSFSELINSYRVEEAKKMLLDKKYRNIKISSIGYDAGFNSRTTFYFWFKRLTGISPFSYQKAEL